MVREPTYNRFFFCSKSCIRTSSWSLDRWRAFPPCVRLQLQSGVWPILPAPFHMSDDQPISVTQIRYVPKALKGPLRVLGVFLPIVFNAGVKEDDDQCVWVEWAKVLISLLSGWRQLRMWCMDIRTLSWDDYCSMKVVLGVSIWRCIVYSAGVKDLHRPKGCEERILSKINNWPLNILTDNMKTGVRDGCIWSLIVPAIAWKDLEE